MRPVGLSSYGAYLCIVSIVLRMKGYQAFWSIRDLPPAVRALSARVNYDGTDIISTTMSGAGLLLLWYSRRSELQAPVMMECSSRQKGAIYLPIVARCFTLSGDPEKTRGENGTHPRSAMTPRRCTLSNALSIERDKHGGSSFHN
jgi:hypothetical protein